jgi:hypothetical protein
MAGGRIGPAYGGTHTLILIQGQLWLSPTFFTSLHFERTPTFSPHCAFFWNKQESIAYSTHPLVVLAF